MSARAYWRQVGAALRKNLRVQNRSRTSCLSLYVVPLALTLVLVPLCYVFVEADRLLGAETGVVRHAAADIPALGATADDAVMIGDRFNDVEGAHAMGVPCIGIYSGAAAPGEHEAAGADAVVHSAAELAKLFAI